MATDHGTPHPLSASTTVNILVTVSTNSPPKFSQHEFFQQLEENLPPNTVVTSLSAESLSTVVYTITAGDPLGYFNINPNSGVVFTLKPVDYEQVKMMIFSIIYCTNQCILITYTA